MFLTSSIRWAVLGYGSFANVASRRSSCSEECKAKCQYVGAVGGGAGSGEHTDFSVLGSDPVQAEPIFYSSELDDFVPNLFVKHKALTSSSANHHSCYLINFILGMNE